jgi:spermidine synthase
MTDKVIFDGETDMARYIVEDSIYNGRAARVLYTNNRLAAQSGVALDGINELLFDYNERFMEVARAIKPRRILQIGGGAFTLPTTLKKEFKKAVIDVIEIDKGLIDISRKYFDLVTDDHLIIYVGDGAKIIDKLTDKYDLIIIDVFNEATIPEDIQNSNFVNKVAKRLSDNGVMAMNIISAYYGPRNHVLNNLIKLYEDRFSYVKAFPAGTDLNLWLSQNFVLTASNHGHNLDKYLRYAQVKDEIN